MSTEEFSLETVRQVWSDKHGTRVEIGPDSDSLELVAIRHKDEQSRVTSEITMPPKQAVLVYQALGQTLKDMGLL